MTLEERAAYAKWQASHEPGPPARRAGKRLRRKQDAEARAMFAREKPVDPEVEKLGRQLEAIKAEIARIEAEQAAQPDEGIFG